jgi:hypothetical protein
MGGTYQRGEPEQVMQPVALATAVDEGDLCAVVADLLVPAASFTWDTDLATTRKAFAAAFLGRAAQEKDAAENVFGNGGDFKLKVRTDTAGVYRYQVADATYKLYDYLAPKKQSGNALESQILELVTDPAQAIAQVVGGEGTNPGSLDAKLLSAKARQSPEDAQIQLIALPINLASLTNADVLTNYTPGFAGEILSVDFVVETPVTTAAKAATLNVEINTTDITGGVVSLTSANATPLGKVIAGTAVTANNVFDNNDTISVEATGVTAFSEGRGVLQIKVRNRGHV